jgi:hypothetical protein
MVHLNFLKPNRGVNPGPKASYPWSLFEKAQRYDLDLRLHKAIAAYEEFLPSITHLSDDERRETYEVFIVKRLAQLYEKTGQFAKASKCWTRLALYFEARARLRPDSEARSSPTGYLCLAASAWRQVVLSSPQLEQEAFDHLAAISERLK